MPENERQPANSDLGLLGGLLSAGEPTSKWLIDRAKEYDRRADYFREISKRLRTLAAIRTGSELRQKGRPRGTHRPNRADLAILDRTESRIRDNARLGEPLNSGAILRDEVYAAIERKELSASVSGYAGTHIKRLKRYWDARNANCELTLTNALLFGLPRMEKPDIK